MGDHLLTSVSRIRHALYPFLLKFFLLPSTEALLKLSQESATTYFKRQELSNKCVTIKSLAIIYAAPLTKAGIREQVVLNNSNISYDS